jgi:hypothetical protein
MFRGVCLRQGVYTLSWMLRAPVYDSCTATTSCPGVQDQLAKGVLSSPSLEKKAIGDAHAVCIDGNDAVCGNPQVCCCFVSIAHVCGPPELFLLRSGTTSLAGGSCLGRWPDSEMPSSAAQAESTADKLAKCQLMVEGPPQPTWLATTPRDSLLLQEALSVAEVVHCMSAFLDCKTVGLLQLQHACRFPLQTEVLPALFVSLIRMCLLEVIQYETPSALRWPRLNLQKAEPIIFVLLRVLCCNYRLPYLVRAPFYATFQPQRLQQFLSVLCKTGR